MAGFVTAIRKSRTSGMETVLRAIGEADRIMYKEGISGAGDISNNGDTLPAKQNSKIHYHTFIEIFGLDKQETAQRFEEALRLAASFRNAGQALSLTPHAPYSVSEDLWELLSREKGLTGRISIHHDESRQERELLEKGTGMLAEVFLGLGFDLKRLPYGADSISALLSRYLPGSECLLVHNTMTDPQLAAAGDQSGRYWVLCPRSNRYIENALPDVEGFAHSGLTLCLGTDSLASNERLSILDEMKEIQGAAPAIRFETVLQWATLNGARALGMDKILGTIEKGKNPGLVNIRVFDFEHERLLPESKSARLI
jgi:cytosine/adenosine deaminase-related metal-dependent hydrolase